MSVQGAKAMEAVPMRSVTRHCLKALEKDPRPGMSRENMMVTGRTAGGDGGGCTCSLGHVYNETELRMF